MAKMIVLTKGHDHLKATEKTGIAVKGENLVTIIAMVPIVK
jgi:hypothetical protein